MGKALYLIILILAVIIVADVLFMFQGLGPIQPPPADGGDGEPITGANIGKNLELLQNTLEDANTVLEGIRTRLNR